MTLFTQYHCVECNYEGSAKSYQNGSYLLLILLFLFFFVPGVIYFFWMLTATYKGCPDCGSKRIIKLNKWRKRQQQEVKQAA